MATNSPTGRNKKDPIVDLMERAKVPVTRENFIAFNWMGTPPLEWSQEDEDQLPEDLRRPPSSA